MKFQEALVEFEKGVKLRRKGWDKDSLYCFVEGKDFHFIKHVEYVDAKPNYEDILSEDWEIVDTEQR